MGVMSLRAIFWKTPVAHMNYAHNKRKMVTLVGSDLPMGGDSEAQGHLQ